MEHALYGQTATTGGASAAGEARPGIGRLAGSLLRHSRELSSDYLQLAVLDARNAAVRFAWMLGLGVIAAILVVTAWLALVAAGIVWMLGTGASWVTALFIAALLNIAVAGALAFMMRGMFADPPFAATLRQLRGDDFASAREPK